MVKPDYKHNYYADLELPTNASVDDVRKAYRKLALLYHPDRNAGKEEECIPKFQAIQAANEVLSDPNSKLKYDTDRRKAGINPSWQQTRQATPGNPYASYGSEFPPPPRRAEQWRRSQQPGNAPNGADRFSNFPRPTNPPRGAAAQDRTNMFRAWQNMSTAQERQRNFTAPGPPPPPPQPPPPQANNARRRPPTAQRQEPNLSTEERIRQGVNYRKVPHNVFDGESAAAGQSAWQAFQNAKESNLGAGRGGAARATPRKQGFDPNTPGSDERAAPMAGSRYAHRHRSEDLGRPTPPPAGQSSDRSSSQHEPDGKPPPRSRTFDDKVPYQEGDRLRTPYSTFIGEKTNGPTAEQLRRSSSSRDTTTLHPSAAANSGARARSNSPVGRNAHTSDASSQKPFVVYSSDESEDDIQNNQSTKSSDEFAASPSDGRPVTAPETSTSTSTSTSTHPNRPKKNPTPPSKRFDGSYNPTSPPPPVPPLPTDAAAAASRAGTNAQNGTSASNSNNNMYDTPTTPSLNVSSSSSQSNNNNNSLFHKQNWLASMFGPHSTRRTSSRSSTVPDWAMPSSVAPPPSTSGENIPKRPKAAISKAVVHKQISPQKKQKNQNETFVTAADQKFISATLIERTAFIQFQNELLAAYSYVPDNFDMDVFFKLVGEIRGPFGSTGHVVLDDLLRRVLVAYPSVGRDQQTENDDVVVEEDYGASVNDDSIHNNSADDYRRSGNDSFSFSAANNNDPSLFNSSSATPLSASKSRSEENINTNFSQQGEWNGKFTGSGDYFGPVGGGAAGGGSNGNGSGRSGPGRRTSPSRNNRPGVSTRTSTRSSTFDVQSPTTSAPRDGGSATTTATTTRPWGSDGLPKVTVEEPESTEAGGGGGGGFSTKQWEQTFKDGSWTWPPKQSQQQQQQQQPSPAVADEDQDAMDIDTPPNQQPAATTTNNTPAASQQEARVYSVPPSAWRQQQARQQKQQQQHQSQQQGMSSSNAGPIPAFPSQGSTSFNPSLNTAEDGVKFNATLDDLRNVEPIAPANINSASTNTTTNPDAPSTTAPGGGLGNLSTLSSTLPFPSQASPNLSDLSPRSLKLPPLPRAPEPPQGRLTRQTWLSYRDNFAAYLRAYHSFNGTMLAHFVARAAQEKELMGMASPLGGGRDVGFLDSVGDTSGPAGSTGDGEGGVAGGFGSYSQAIAEDAKVREAWNLGAERHAEAVRLFGGVREQVRRLVASGPGLAES